MAVTFLGKQYSIPKGLLVYIDLLAFSEKLKQELTEAFLKKAEEDADSLIYNFSLKDEILSAAERYVAMLCSNQIYDKTANDMLAANRGYMQIEAANQKAKNELRTIEERCREIYQNDVQQANAELIAKMSSVTPTKYHYSGSSTDIGDIKLQIGTMRVDERALSEQKAKISSYHNNKIYHLEAKTKEKYLQRKKAYVLADYVPEVRSAIENLFLGFNRDYLNILSRHDRFQQSALQYTNLNRSNDLLTNLKLSENKAEILGNAFIACPYNLQVYIECVNAGLTDKSVFRAAKIFRQLDRLMEHLKSVFDAKTPSEDLKKDLIELEPVIEALSHAAKKTKSEYYRQYTLGMRNHLAAKYNDIIRRAEGTKSCDSLIDQLGDGIVSMSELDLQEYAYSYVSAAADDENFKVLADIWGYEELMEDIASDAAKAAGCVQKTEYDQYYASKINDRIQELAQIKKSQIRTAEAEKIADAKKRIRKGKRNQVICWIIMLALVIVPYLVRSIMVDQWCSEIEDYVQDRMEENFEEYFSVVAKKKKGYTGEFEITGIDYRAQESMPHLTLVPHITLYTSKGNIREIDEDEVDMICKIWFMNFSSELVSPWYIFDTPIYNIYYNITVVGSDGTKSTYQQKKFLLAKEYLVDPYSPGNYGMYYLIYSALVFAGFGYAIIRIKGKVTLAKEYLQE